MVPGNLEDTKWDLLFDSEEVQVLCFVDFVQKSPSGDGEGFVEAESLGFQLNAKRFQAVLTWWFRVTGQVDGQRLDGRAASRYTKKPPFFPQELIGITNPSRVSHLSRCIPVDGLQPTWENILPFSLIMRLLDNSWISISLSTLTCF